MANYTPSNLVKAQTRYTSQFTEAELKSKQSPALMLAMGNKSVLPGYENLRTREDRTVSVYMKSRNAGATGTGRTHNHTGNRGDSFTADLVWATISKSFSISMKQFDNNIFGWEEAYAHEVFTAALDIHEKIETNSIDFLKTNKTGVNVATAKGSFNATNDTFGIAEANREQFYQILRAMMRANNYRGSIDVLADQLIYIDAEKYVNQGAGNATNLAYQFQGLNIKETIELADANYTNGLALAIPSGMFAAFDWIPKQNRQGKGDYFSVLGGYGSIPDPTGSGLTLAMHAYTERADTSSANGDEQDDLLQVELSVDIAYALAPLSNDGETPVFQVGITA